MRGRAKLTGAMATATAAVALTACGGERTFTAQEFVDEVKAEGVELRLGKELITDEEGKEIYALELEPVADLPDEAEAHSAGSISAYDEAGDADAELQSCEASADLLCYRASNVVIVLEGGGGVETQQLGVAIERLSED